MSCENSITDNTTNVVIDDQYGCKISIDTIHLTAILDDQQKQYVYDRFCFNYNSPGFYYRYSQFDTRSLGFALLASPYNSFTHKHYNHMIQLQKEITTTDYMPYSLNEIISNIDWNTSRIDLAFDFDISLENSLIMKHHGNVQFDSSDKWQTEYLGKLKSRSPSKLAHYDRNIKELERQTNIKHDHFNRFEVRMFPKTNNENMKLHNITDDFILQHLKKYIIIPNINILPTNKWNKNRLYKTKQDYDYIKTLEPKQQRELKDLVKAHRLPLEQLYLKHKDNLFAFMQQPLQAI